jgi:hypothetical protein
LAPPVGLASPVPLVLSLAFSFSAEVPPAAPPAVDPLELSLFDGSPLDSLLGASSLEDPVEEVAPDVPLDVVDVDVVCAEAFSAEVSVGGMMSGVLLGTASELALAPPHPANVEPARSTIDATAAARPIDAQGRRRRAWPSQPASG